MVSLPGEAAEPPSAQGVPAGRSSASDLARLQQAAEALGLVLGAPVLAQLLLYRDLLLRWNRVYNLTAVRDPADMLDLHLVDCLAVIPPLDRWLQGRSGVRLLDAGSGGGLPGIVLAIVRPQWSVVCADAVAKKVAFVRQAAGELGLQQLSAVQTRLEVWQDRAGFDLVISRAFASLVDFVGCTQQLLRADGVWVAMKGRVPDAEMAALPSTVEVFHVEHLGLPSVAAERCLVWMRPRTG